MSNGEPVENKEKIEITPEMIEAGVGELVRHISDAQRILPDEKIVSRVFVAMSTAPQNQEAS